MIGVIFYDAPTAVPLLELLYAYGIDAIVDLSYNITVDAVVQKLYTPEERREAYQFCNISFGPCSVVMFNTFDEKTHSVSDYHYQVRKPACEDTFYVSDQAWENLLTPPLPLEERYFSCKPAVFDALFNSLGIAAGNTATLVPLLCLCFLPLLYVYLQAAGRVPPKAEYTPAELDSAIKALSLIMLRIRDGKLRGIKKGSVLQNLTTDLIAAAKEEGGYPDSDDEEEEEEDEDENPVRKSIARKRRSTLGDPMKKNAKSAVFIKPSEEEEQPAEQGGFWSSLFSSSEPTTTETGGGSKNPMVELSSKPAASMVVLNEGLAGASVRKSKMKTIPPANYFLEVTAILNAMQRAGQVRGIDGSAAAFKIAKQKTENLFMIRAELRDAEFDRSDLFGQIYTILLTNITLEYQCTTEEAVSKYSDQAAYNVGGRVYTATDLLRKKENFFSI
jgi:hypothetical protein